MNGLDLVLMAFVVIVGVLVGLLSIVTVAALLVGMFAKGYDASREKEIHARDKVEKDAH